MDFEWSGRADLNCRPLAPQAVTLLFGDLPSVAAMCPEAGIYAPFTAFLGLGPDRGLLLSISEGPHNFPHSFRGLFCNEIEPESPKWADEVRRLQSLGAGDFVEGRGVRVRKA
jgi:hypothetical protein